MCMKSMEMMKDEPRAHSRDVRPAVPFLVLDHLDSNGEFCVSFEDT